jgi:hypothetical protein
MQAMLPGHIAMRDRWNAVEALDAFLGVVEAISPRLRHTKSEPAPWDGEGCLRLAKEI